MTVRFRTNVFICELVGFRSAVYLTGFEAIMIGTFVGNFKLNLLNRNG